MEMGSLLAVQVNITHIWRCCNDLLFSFGFHLGFDAIVDMGDPSCVFLCKKKYWKMEWWLLMDQEWMMMMLNWWRIVVALFLFSCSVALFPIHSKSFCWLIPIHSFIDFHSSHSALNILLIVIIKRFWFIQVWKRSQYIKNYKCNEGFYLATMGSFIIKLICMYLWLYHLTTIIHEDKDSVETPKGFIFNTEW